MIPGITASRRRATAGAVDPYWSNVALLLQLDTNFYDSSASPKTVNNSLGSIVASPSKFGAGAVSLPGGGSRLTTGSYSLGSGSFCIELWLYLPTLPNAQRGLFGNTASSPYLFIGLNSSNRVFATFNGLITIGGGPEHAITAGTWNHIAIVRSGSNIKLYINGVASLLGTGTNSTNFTDTTHHIGSYSTASGDSLKCVIDDVRVTIGQARYTENFTPPTAPFPTQGPPAEGDPYWDKVALLLHMDGADGSTTFTDSSGSPKSISAVGNAQISTAQSAFGGASAYFDGTGDGLSIPFSSDLSLQGVDFVVEGLARYNGASGYQTLIDFRGSAAYTASWGAFLDIANRSFGIYDGTVSSTVLYTTTNSVPPPGNWFSWCVEKDGPTTRIYIGGNLETSSSSWSPPATHSSGVRIGINQAGLDAFNGYMDELRITKGVARYADNYTPQTKPFPNQGLHAVSPVAYEYTGSNQTLTVPVGVTSVNVKLWGAGGAGGSRAPIAYMDAAPGGGGGFTEGTLSVTPGETLTIIVGGGGTQSNSGGQNPRTFGDGGFGWGGGNQSGGAGGGRSAIRRGSIELATAGGGGGGGSTGNTGGAGGAGGGSVGMDGQGDTRGTGGTQTTGGSASPGSGNGAQLGAAFYGGNAGGIDGAGGGAGGGYFGGGGGGGNGSHGAGGGGGSGYTGGLIDATMESGTSTTPGGQVDPDRMGAGVGGAQRANGANGRVVIRW